MKVLLTHSYFLEEDQKEKEIMRPYAPLGILYISAYLDRQGIENEVFDTTFSSFNSQQEYILQKLPDVLAVYTNLMTKLNVIRLIKWIKSESSLANTKVVLGGPEVRHHADDFLNIGADVVIVGEGEETMFELIRSYEGGIDLTNVAGLVYKQEDGSIQINQERKLLKDINELPLPNRSKINIENYLNAWKTHHGFSMMSVSTMRGCPYTCKWCSRAVYGGTYRRRSPKLVAEEMLHVKQKYNPDMIWFVDDVFTIHHRWLKEFASEVKTLNAVIPYEIISRSDRLNEEVMQYLKDSGCERIWIGAESGSQKIIDAMDRRVSVKETLEMIQLAKRYKIKTGTFIMLGYPGETKEDIKQTINYLTSAKPDTYTVTIAYPIKGTPLYEEVKEHMLSEYNFETNTDRDMDFKRLHPRRFYEHALKWVEMEVYLKNVNSNFLKIPYLKLKSMKHRLMMQFNT